MCCPSDKRLTDTPLYILSALWPSVITSKNRQPLGGSSSSSQKAQKVVVMVLGKDNLVRICRSLGHRGCLLGTLHLGVVTFRYSILALVWSTGVWTHYCKQALPPPHSVTSIVHRGCSWSGFITRATFGDQIPGEPSRMENSETLISVS